MSYFTFASSDYDVPHPTLSRNQPRFYIHDRPSQSPAQASTPIAGGDSLHSHSRHPSINTFTPAYSGASTPYHRGSFYGGYGSRTSMAALRHALNHYHAHSESPTTDSLTPYARPANIPSGECPPPGGGARAGHVDGTTYQQSEVSGGPMSWDSDLWRVPGQPLDALIDIHRVLYRGSEFEDGERNVAWSEHGKEVKRVIDQWFEGDCIYDHPLVRLSSRQSVLTHFTLLQLLATAYVPSFTPSSILHHARGVTSYARRALLGSDSEDLSTDHQTRGMDVCPAGEIDEWLQSSGPDLTTRRSADPNGWWKLWDVSAECRDIGCMECYEGYHVALIDHVISLTLFPSIIKPRQTGLSPEVSTDSLSSAYTSPSYLHSIVASVIQEFDFLLHWDLPVSTIVEFNEVGKATHIRDVVDVRDVVDTFVPFAKRFNWLSRRLTGMLTSTIGSVAMALIPGHSVVIGDPIRIMDEHQAAKSKEEEEKRAKVKDLATNDGLGCSAGLATSTGGGFCATGVEHNSLGLEGVSSMAPDVDGEGQDA